jgi:hypothetical protein
MSRFDLKHDNILEQNPPPSGEHEKRIRFFAKALAYGALADKWTPYFVIEQSTTGQDWIAEGHVNYNDRLNKYLHDVWGGQQPQASFLDSFGYLERQADRSRSNISSTHYKLTPHAYALLEKPAILPRVFISYCHKTSSAFALMLEYRLEADGIPVFVDRSIRSGGAWKPQLKAAVQSCQFFVCLITPEAIRSKAVQDEIQWAENQMGIPIWQPGFDHKTELVDCPQWLKEFVENNHAIRVLEESAEAYHNAVEKLRHDLGFASI